MNIGSLPSVKPQTKKLFAMKTHLLTALMAVGATLFFTAAVTAAPRVGDVAPLFTGTDQDGKTVKLADFIGKKIVLLYFYPKDFTSGCTKEACGFRDRVGKLQEDNVEVIGVSFDSAESHRKFIAQYHLNFPLLADPDGKIADLYDARMDHLNMTRRVSFLIGLDGKIAHITDSGNPDVHFSQMQEAIAALKK